MNPRSTPLGRAAAKGIHDSQLTSLRSPHLAQPRHPVFNDGGTTGGVE